MDASGKSQLCEHPTIPVTKFLQQPKKPMPMRKTPKRGTMKNQMNKKTEYETHAGCNAMDCKVDCKAGAQVRLAGLLLRNLN